MNTLSLDAPLSQLMLDPLDASTGYQPDESPSFEVQAVALLLQLMSSLPSFRWSGQEGLMREHRHMSEESSADLRALLQPRVHSGPYSPSPKRHSHHCQDYCAVSTKSCSSSTSSSGPESSPTWALKRSCHSPSPSMMDDIPNASLLAVVLPGCTTSCQFSSLTHSCQLLAPQAL